MKEGKNQLIENREFRKHILCATVLTRKFVMLVMIAKCIYENEGRFGELCDTILDRSAQLLTESARNASNSTGILTERLYHTIQLYNEKDEKLVAASIRHKIKLYLECLDEALSAPSPVPLPLHPTGLYRINTELLCDLTDDQICLELIDYADEIDAWLDIEFEDEYDDYCIEDQGFDCYVELSAKLWMLAKLIREHN